MALGRVQLELDGSFARAEVDAARHRQSLDLAERQRPRPGQVELGVVVAQLALGLPGLAPQPLDRGLPEPQGQARKGEPPEQMVEVRVRREQAVGLEARAGEQPGEGVELVREIGRVDQHGLPARAQRHSVRLPERARHDERVRTDGYRSQAAFSSLPASRKVRTSASGFLPSGSSPCLLTQITGVFI